MDMKRFDLANSFHQEQSDIMGQFLKPEDISVIHGEPGFDGSNYLATPKKVTGGHCESIHIKGDITVKRQWLRVLPNISGLRRAVLNTTAISEELMQAVCAHDRIERLLFESTRLESLEVLSQLHQLTHLAIGSSPRVSSFSPLTNLKRLVSLSIQGNFPKIDRLDDIGELESLRGLSLSGQDYKDLRIRNLEPISKLINLRFLGLTSVRASGGGLRPLHDLPALEFVYLDPFQMHFWGLSDIAALNEAFPKLRGSLIRRVATEPNIAKTLRVS